MQVLKFGGSSLADAKNMLKAADIIAKATDRDRTIVVASAIYKCTDTLIRIGNLAAAHDSSYLGLLDELQEKHIKSSGISSRSRNTKSPRRSATIHSRRSEALPRAFSCSEN